MNAKLVYKQTLSDMNRFIIGFSLFICFFYHPKILRWMEVSNWNDFTLIEKTKDLWPNLNYGVIFKSFNFMIEMNVNQWEKQGQFY